MGLNFGAKAPHIFYLTITYMRSNVSKTAFSDINFLAIFSTNQHTESDSFFMQLFFLPKVYTLEILFFIFVKILLFQRSSPNLVYFYQLKKTCMSKHNNSSNADFFFRIKSKSPL